MLGGQDTSAKVTVPKSSSQKRLFGRIGLKGADTSDIESNSSSRGGLFKGILPLGRNRRGHTTGSVENSKGSVELLKEKGCNSGDFVPRVPHPLLENPNPLTDPMATESEVKGM